MNRCNAALYSEYPKITMFGETWVHGVASQAYFARNNFQHSFKSNLIGVTDFQTLVWHQPGADAEFRLDRRCEQAVPTLS
jgi:hypothetical protein